MAEVVLRKRYGAFHIVDGDAQKILGGVRRLAEEGRLELEKFQDVALKMTTEKPWAIRNYLDWDGQDRIMGAIYCQDMAICIHQELVNICDQYQNGAAFRFGRNYDDQVTLTKLGGDKLADILNRKIEVSISNLIMGYFNASRPTSWERAFISDMREVLYGKYHCMTFSEVKDDS